MVTAKRGLVAPQNTFLENVIRRCNNADSTFILANAQIVDYPIVYCNDGFSKMIGYPRAEIMQKPCSLSFMYGDQTDENAIQKIQKALSNTKTEQTEIELVKKNKSVIWLIIHIAPIKDDRDQVVLYLCQFKDITPLKQPLGDENNKGLSRILQIARIAKSKQQFNQIDTKDLQRSHKSIASVSSNFNQVMNLGGDMLPQYRQETPKTSPHIILHYSTFKTVWDWSILGLTFYTAFMVPYNIAFKTRDYLKGPPKTIDHVAMMDSIVDVIFFADILLNFHTTFVGPGGEVVIDPSIIRRNYFKSWFIIDLLSCLPYDIFYMFKHDDERIGSLFSALKVVRLLRLGRVARKLDNYLEYGAATLLLLLCAYVLVAHWMACIWYSIGEYEVKQRMIDGAYPDNWLVKLGNDLKQPFIFNITRMDYPDRVQIYGGPERTTTYLSSLYFTMSCMSTVGFGNIASNTANEKLFSIIMMIISALLYAAIFGHMTTIIQQMTASRVRYHEMISNVREFIKLQEIPKELSERVIDYVTSTYAMTKGIDISKILGYCPKDMKADICVHLNRKVFNEHACFRLASDGCLRSFAVYLETNHAAPGDLLYHTGESVDALWFVVQGSLEVIQDEEVVAILGKGDVFGDEFWKTSHIGQSAANVRALTYTDLHMIKKESLMEVLNFYKSFANSFARNLVLTYNLTHRLRFRKMADVQREKELDERRKHEKLTFPEDHPVRKLLQRMREKHASKVLPINSDIVNNRRDLERSSHKHKDIISRGSSLKSISISPDDIGLCGGVGGNETSNEFISRAPSLGALRKRSPLMKGKTFDDGSSEFRPLHPMTRFKHQTSSPNVSVPNLSHGYDSVEAIYSIKNDVQRIDDQLGDQKTNIDKIQQQLNGIEKLLKQLTLTRNGIGTPSTYAMGSFSGLAGGDTSPYHDRSPNNWAFFPSDGSGTQIIGGQPQLTLSPQIPPLRDLQGTSESVTGHHGGIHTYSMDEEIPPNVVPPLIYIDQPTPSTTSTRNLTTAPPLNRDGAGDNDLIRRR
ncbi:Potassium voltage-gated channel subfamily H member 5 [Strongyloides ratti]|uniref:Potassium voltage-gated channel subfamily H member 5 n=1 Tax=Strongyloides ratti TaxID=34506 RepID=A0A090L2J5_STRRB|nr:Potassium voltage-gated channel subfamily H member 5 [Strongyloides ratti]CEF62317.1 Potassium voltage-gated channel subfamily H member 5 [Strongyloides ratti]